MEQTVKIELCYDGNVRTAQVKTNYCSVEIMMELVRTTVRFLYKCVVAELARGKNEDDLQMNCNISWES